MCFPFFSEIIFYFKQLTNDIENKYNKVFLITEDKIITKLTNNMEIIYI